MRIGCKVAGGVLLGTLFVTAGTAQAMPNFARKYGWTCNMCHTTIPRLNEFGFRFRKAGFRDPSEIGVAQKVKLEDVNTARIQANYAYKSHNDGTTSSTSNQLTLQEVTLYPLTGSFGKNYASMMELSILNEDFVEIENAYFRYTLGKEKWWFTGRIGIFHPFEGYGGSDRPYSLARPFIQTTVASHNGSTFFTPWNFDQAGFELAYVYERTSISATVFNGIWVKDDEGTYKAFPAAGGNLVKSSGFANKNSKDFQLFVNQILKDDGSGVSGYFYKGWSDLPIPGTTPDAFAPGTSFGNSYWRAAIYASWMFIPQFGLQGGGLWGRDHFYDPATQSSDGTFDSRGWFLEGDAPLMEHLTAGVRYDEWDPSTKKDQNKKSGVTVFANIPLNDGFQAIAEYQHIQQQVLGKPDVKDDNFQIRIIWIW